MSPVAGQKGRWTGCHKWNVCELHTASYKSRRQVGGRGGGRGKAGRGKRGSQFGGVIGGQDK